MATNPVGVAPVQAKSGGSLFYFQKQYPEYVPQTIKLGDIEISFLGSSLESLGSSIVGVSVTAIENLFSFDSTR